MKRYLLAILVSLGVAALQAADTVYVKAGSTPEAPYDTEENAFATLADAVTYAATELSVKKIHIVGTQTLTAKVTLAGIEVFGDSRTATTITGSGGINPLVAVGDNVLLHDLKFSHNNTQGTAGAVFNMTGDHSVISNCWVNGAKTKTGGNNIAGSASAGLITHCLFSGNASNNGGCNAAKTMGAGLLGLSGTARMRNSVFTGNGHNGSIRGPCDGVLQMSGTAVMENCVVYGNWNKASSGEGDTTEEYRPRRGGGILFTGGTPTVRNCIVRNNKVAAVPSDGNYPTQTDPKEDIYSATVEKNFNILSGNPVIENCNTAEGQVPEGAVDCQTDLPGFTDAAGGDFSIAADSPCVDAGLFQKWQIDATDYTGVTPRYQGEGVDIGAYEVVKPTPPTAHIELGGTLEAEKYATATMSAFVTGLKVDSGATFKWYASDPQAGTPEPFAVGNPAEYRFTEGTWTIYLKIENAGGAGVDLYESVADAVVVTRGADFYVSAEGDDEASGDIDAPFKTLEKAFESAKTIEGVARIRVIGRVTQSQMNYSVSNVEVFGGDRTEDMLVANTGGAQQDYPILVLGDNTFFHDLKVVKGTCSYLRTVLQLTSESAVVSNCWFSALSSNTLYDKYGNIAGYAKAGLITHCLFTDCSSGNGGGQGKLGVNFLCLDGTAKMRNCVFTKNAITGNARGDLAGVMAIMGNAVMENCVVYDNYVQDGGSTYKGRYTGGVFVRGGSPVIKDCIIRKNTMSAEGETKAHSQEADIYVASGATPKISFCNIPEGQIPDGATNCQTGDPKFTDPDNTTVANRDFSIAEDSPCVDAGNGKGWRKGATDYAGNPRIQGRRVDIGAYEYNSGVVDWGLQILVR